MRHVNAVVLGSMNFDCFGYTPRFLQRGETLVGDSFKTFSGGKGANQAVQLALLGADVSFIGCVGNDSFGSMLFDNLRKYGIHTDFVTVRDDVPTGVCMITVDATGDNTVLYFPGANQRLLEEDVNRAETVIQKADVFLTQNEINLEVVAFGLEMAKRHGVTTILNPAPAVLLSEELYGFVDYITPNETEAEAYTGICRTDMKLDEWLARTSAWFLDKGVKHAVITLGEQGAYYNNGTVQRRFPAFPVKVLDTTAAGDAFNGGMAYILASHGDVNEAILVGCACGALAAQNKGAQSSMEDKATLKDYLRAQKKSVPLG